MRYIISLFVICSLLVGCSSDSTSDDKVADAVADVTIGAIEAEAESNDFHFRVWSEKAEYRFDEPVQLVGEIEYIGEADLVHLAHSSSAIFFDLTEEIRQFHIGFAVNDIGLETVLKQGEKLTETYVKSGGYSDLDDKDYQAFMKDFFERDDFPIGHYTVKASTDFYVKELDDYVKLEAEIEFKVVP